MSIANQHFKRGLYNIELSQTEQQVYSRTQEPMLGNSLVWMLFQVSHVVCTADGKFCIKLWPVKFELQVGINRFYTNTSNKCIDQLLFFNNFPIYPVGWPCSGLSQWTELQHSLGALHQSIYFHLPLGCSSVGKIYTRQEWFKVRSG